MKYFLFLPIITSSLLLLLTVYGIYAGIPIPPPDNGTLVMLRSLNLGFWILLFFIQK